MHNIVDAGQSYINNRFPQQRDAHLSCPLKKKIIDLEKSYDRVLKTAAFENIDEISASLMVIWKLNNNYEGSDEWENCV